MSRSSCTRRHHGRPKGCDAHDGNIAWNNVNFLHTTAFGSDEVALVVATVVSHRGLNGTTLIGMQRGPRSFCTHV